MATKASHSSSADRDAYFEQVLSFPLKSIKTDKELRSAIKKLDSLLAKGDLDTGEEAYFNALSDLVSHYEDHKFHPGKATAVEVLHHLLEANKCNRTEFAKEVGLPKSTISEILNGKRSINLAHAKAFAVRFGISFNAFID